MASVLSSPRTAPAVGRRGAARLRLAVPATFVSVFSWHACILVDLSRTGARIALPRPLPQGHSGYVAIAGLELFGMIVRAEPGANTAINAIAFEGSISHEDVLAVRRFADGFALRERKVLRDYVRRWVAGEA